MTGFAAVPPTAPATTPEVDAAAPAVPPPVEAAAAAAPIPGENAIPGLDRTIDGALWLTPGPAAGGSDIGAGAPDAEAPDMTAGPGPTLIAGGAGAAIVLAAPAEAIGAGDAATALCAVTVAGAIVICSDPAGSPAELGPFPLAVAAVSGTVVEAESAEPWAAALEALPPDTDAPEPPVLRSPGAAVAGPACEADCPSAADSAGDDAEDASL